MEEASQMRMVIPVNVESSKFSEIQQGKFSGDYLKTIAHVEQIVARFIGEDPRARMIILTGDQREKLEQIFGGGDIKTPADLVSKVQRLAALKIEGVDIKFSTGQLEELKRRAEKNDRTLEQEVELVAGEMSWRFFAGGF